ncbi:hypothetical protein SAMN05660420_01243 [Desulfuromusa kysingii]|uniref:Uncharacterized protein n=1 Tax=Desulfuromusa kysingii TaxID=37625 RepID=A0A1H3YII5_9BACT|nr:hypothetical protein [Desulfuromusa kysingii]SEA11011.1 hypothetical protein SAMN05660420_01243 [Desulfuromusa kysingii]
MSVLLVFQGAINKPYRTAPIDEQTMKVTVGHVASPIFVDLKTSKYIKELQGDAIKSGWVIGNPLIDLTGGSPGAAYILGATAPGSPWILGGYSGSTKFAKTALGYADRSSLDNAWLLIAPEGRRQLSLSVLTDLDLLFPENYIYVGKFTNPTRRETQKLYRPKSENDFLDLMLHD